MSWNELPLYVRTLEASLVNKVYENLEYLRAAAVEKGLTVDVLDVVSAAMNTPVTEIVNVLNGIEGDIDIVNEQVAESVYYDEQNIVQGSFTLQDYQRWVLCLNDLYDIIVNDKGQWGVLQLSDGYPTIENKKIIIRGKSIGN